MQLVILNVLSHPAHIGTRHELKGDARKRLNEHHILDCMCSGFGRRCCCDVVSATAARIPGVSSFVYSIAGSDIAAPLQIGDNTAADSQPPLRSCLLHRHCLLLSTCGQAIGIWEHNAYRFFRVGSMAMLEEAQKMHVHMPGRSSRTTCSAGVLRALPIAQH